MTTILGIMAPVLAAGAMAAVDYSALYRARSETQSVGDKAALMAAKELVLVYDDAERVKSVALAYVEANLASDEGDSEPAKTTAVIGDDLMSVEVRIERHIPGMLASVLGDAVRTVATTSVARLPARAPTCVIALSQTAIGAIDMKEDAVLTAENCAIFSNSTKSNGMRLSNQARISASFICSAGGKEGSLSQYDPRPLTDCPLMDDPLSARPAPAGLDTCDHTDLVVSAGTVSLLPGTYCGGLAIQGGARVTLTPGTFVIKDGALTVDGGASMEGKGVALYFEGDKATLSFEQQSSVSLTAPTTGPLAGLLMFESRAAKEGRAFRISSDSARVLLGTIYLPRGDLIVDGREKVADKSAFTVIVARAIKLAHGPDLVLNTDYYSTEVPVPTGLGPPSDPAYLAN